MKLDDLRLSRELDRRFHLTEEEREEIQRAYRDGQGIRSIARDYEQKCTRRLIQFIIFPDRYEKALIMARKRRKAGLYKPTRAERNRIMREHRAYKRRVLTKTI